MSKEIYTTCPDGSIQSLFLPACKRKDNTFIQMLLLKELAYGAADRIYNAIVASEEGPKYLKPILRPYDYIGSTRYVDFDTTRPVYPTDPAKCHISHVVDDTESWEQKMAQALEEMGEVICFVKNHNLGFTIPYTLNGGVVNDGPQTVAQKFKPGSIAQCSLRRYGKPAGWFWISPG